VKKIQQAVPARWFDMTIESDGMTSKIALDDGKEVLGRRVDSFSSEKGGNQTVLVYRNPANDKLESVSIDRSKSYAQIGGEKGSGEWVQLEKQKGDAAITNPIELCAGRLGVKEDTVMAFSNQLGLIQSYSILDENGIPATGNTWNFNEWQDYRVQPNVLIATSHYFNVNEKGVCEPSHTIAFSYVVDSGSRL